MESLPAERKALLFTAGGVRLALRLSQIREIVATVDDAPEVAFRGARVPCLPVAIPLGLPAGPSRFAVVTELSPPLALRVEALHGIVDLGGAEVFQLPAWTVLPQPPPFLGAIVWGGVVALELAVPTLGWAPIEPAPELPGPPPELEFPTARELQFQRGEHAYAVPVHLLAQVLESPTVYPVPLAPSAHRGLLYHGRAIHPAVELGVLYGERTPLPPPAHALLVDAGGTTMAVLADRVLPAGEGARPELRRPGWDALFAAP